MRLSADTAYEDDRHLAFSGPLFVFFFCSARDFSSWGSSWRDISRFESEFFWCTAVYTRRIAGPNRKEHTKKKEKKKEGQRERSGEVTSGEGPK